MSAREMLTLSNGTQVSCSVEYSCMGMWLATEVDYDLGRPHGEGTSALAALDDLRIELESELP